MKNRGYGLVCALLALSLAACTPMGPVRVGDSEAQVLAARGKPSHRYLLNDGQLLEYNYGPYGQQTYMARLDTTGKVISFEQVLTNEKFAQIQVDKSTKKEVLYTVGAPSRIAYFPLSKLESWLYPYKDDAVWNFIMYVGFDAAGVVRKVEKAPDLQFVPQPGNLFGAYPK